MLKRRPCLHGVYLKNKKKVFQFALPLYLCAEHGRKTIELKNIKQYTRALTQSYRFRARMSERRETFFNEKNVFKKQTAFRKCSSKVFRRYSLPDQRLRRKRC